MLISKAIKRLEHILESHGDLELYKFWEWYTDDMVGLTDESVHDMKVETRNVSIKDRTKFKVVVIK